MSAALLWPIRHPRASEEGQLWDRGLWRRFEGRLFGPRVAEGDAHAGEAVYRKVWHDCTT